MQNTVHSMLLFVQEKGKVRKHIYYLPLYTHKKTYTQGRINLQRMKLITYKLGNEIEGL